MRRTRTIGPLLLACLLTFLLPACSLIGGVQSPAPTGFPPQPTGPIPLEVTLTAIVKAKATDAAQMQLTLSAVPTNTTTPTAPPDTVNCAPGDLSGEARSNGATGSITFGIVLTNVSNKTCLLPGPPSVQLVNPQGFALDLDVTTFCFNCAETQTGTATVAPTGPAPTQTAQASQALNETLSLPPGAKARVFLIWSNWCQPFPPGGVSIRLNLPGNGQMDLLTDARTGGRCDVQTARSTLLVSQYTYQ